MTKKLTNKQQDILYLLSAGGSQRWKLVVFEKGHRRFLNPSLISGCQLWNSGECLNWERYTTFTSMKRKGVLIPDGEVEIAGERCKQYTARITH